MSYTYKQVPRYSSLKTLLSGVLQHFLTLNVAFGSPDAAPAVVPREHTTTEALLRRRMSLFDDYLDECLPRNTRDKSKLIECGYSSRLWDEVWQCYSSSVLSILLGYSIFWWKSEPIVCSTANLFGCEDRRLAQSGGKHATNAACLLSGVPWYPRANGHHSCT